MKHEHYEKKRYIDTIESRIIELCLKIHDLRSRNKCEEHEIELSNTIFQLNHNLNMKEMLNPSSRVLH